MLIRVLRGGPRVFSPQNRICLYFLGKQAFGQCQSTSGGLTTYLHQLKRSITQLDAPPMFSVKGKAVKCDGRTHAVDAHLHSAENALNFWKHL